MPATLWGNLMATADFVSEVSPEQQQLPILDYFHFFISSFILSILAMLLPVFQKKNSVTKNILKKPRQNACKKPLFQKKRHQKYFKKNGTKNACKKPLFTV